VDLEGSVDGDPVLRAGGEVWVGGRDFAAAFRGGYSFNPLTRELGDLVGASLGGGVRYTGLELNYALVPFGALGNTHRFSMTYRFGGGEDPGSEAKKPSAIEIQPQIADYQTGTVKQATFDLKPQARTDIKDWVLEITDPSGNVIRTYRGKGVPPRQITWDGRDGSGNTVAGGLYANYNFRTVDARGQRVVSSDPIYRISQVEGRQSPRMASIPDAGPRFESPSLPAGLAPAGLRGLLKIPGIAFAPNSANLDRAFLGYLDQVAELIRRHPNARVYIEGHSFEEGGERGSLLLSQGRADAVMRYLVERGRVSPDNLFSRGHGDSAPLVMSVTPEARSRNRRVDIIIFTK
jgi:outer membrane protein OmpA-like peptidoglycan-associated protein